MTDDGSILNDTKKVLGFDPDYDAFDTDILMHINSTLGTLHQLGVGPKTPFMVQDDKNQWNELLQSDNTLISVKSYIWASVRLMFDPPSTSFGITALENLKKELEWRLNVAGDRSDGD